MRGRKVEVFWSHPETEDDYLVTCYVTMGSPGRLYGPPDSCYPPEGAEVEVLSIEHDGGEHDGEPATVEEESALMDDPKELGRVEDKAVEAAEDDHRAAYEAAAEARADMKADR
jgi:hypothetical protein